MHAIETTASFDSKGEIKIDKSLNIKNQKVKLLILLPEIENNDWYQFSSQSLSDAYSETEPEYTLNMINEMNPDFKP